MKIYFCGSIGGGRQDAHLYGRLIKKLEKYGTVLTTHVGDLHVIENEKDMTDKEIHDRDVTWLKQADAVVAEVTQTSMGVGYEIGRAIGMNKPVLCVFRPDTGKVHALKGTDLLAEDYIKAAVNDSTQQKVSAMVGGCDDGKSVIFKRYKEEEIDGIFAEFFKSL